jgi:hypothetical protein
VSGVVIMKAVQTCVACPSQWDAWDQDGNYWYLRYRHGRGTAERQPGPGWQTWDLHEADISFEGQDDDDDGCISLERFCELAGLPIDPECDRTSDL